MFGMGATLTINDFKEVMREPRAVTLGIIIQLVLVPSITFFFIRYAGLAIGTALIASIPGGTISIIFTYLAPGNTPLSISITGLTTFACLITTPLILGLLITRYLPADFVMLAEQIISEIALTLLLSLLLDMMLLRYISQHAGWFSTWSIRASLFGIFLIIAASSSAGRLDVTAFGTENIALVSAFFAILVVSSWVIARLWQQSR
jgi:BASS family bile acid:Na+ symporter